MSETKHTPGPWKAHAGIGKWFVVTNSKPRTFNVCSVSADRDEQEANARLIAAAPELLDVCQKMIKEIEYNTGYCWQDELRAAIAKATGG